MRWLGSVTPQVRGWHCAKCAEGAKSVTGKNNSAVAAGSAAKRPCKPRTSSGLVGRQSEGWGFLQHGANLHEAWAIRLNGQVSLSDCTVFLRQENAV